MPPCPNNATDCLLRKLIDAQNHNTWDPLNFAFTAILGILAVIVAIVTLFQTLLAAGPGRLKASRGAIGLKFNRSAKTRFSWTEFRMRTTVLVPELDLKQIIDLIEIESPAYEGNGAAGSHRSMTDVASEQRRDLKAWRRLRRLIKRERDSYPSHVKLLGKGDSGFSTENSSRFSNPHAGWVGLLATNEAGHYQVASNGVHDRQSASRYLRRPRNGNT